MRLYLAKTQKCSNLEAGLSLSLQSRWPGSAQVGIIAADGARTLDLHLPPPHKKHAKDKKSPIPWHCQPTPPISQKQILKLDCKIKQKIRVTTTFYCMLIDLSTLQLQTEKIRYQFPYRCMQTIFHLTGRTNCSKFWKMSVCTFTSVLRKRKALSYAFKGGDLQCPVQCFQNQEFCLSFAECTERRFLMQCVCLQCKYRNGLSRS